MEWINVKERLPEFDKYVLGRYNLKNWHDKDDQENVICVVVKFIKSKIEGNNLCPYQWDTFGPSKFFGQEISYWAELPKPPIDEEKVDKEDYKMTDFDAGLIADFNKRFSDLFIEDLMKNFDKPNDPPSL